jgi:molecular chaperone IbpA
MTNAKQLAVADLRKIFLGFDQYVNHENFFSSTMDGGYPRFNIVKSEEEGRWRIEVAVPGWSKEDISIKLHNGVLTVSGTNKQSLPSGERYVHKGLSGRCFEKTFAVNKHVKLDRAYMERGLLCIDLHEELPEELKPVTISIN